MSKQKQPRPPDIMRKGGSHTDRTKYDRKFQYNLDEIWEEMIRLQMERQLDIEPEEKNDD